MFKTVDFPMGKLVPVAENLFLLRMPMPFQLNHINLYLLRDYDGWIVIDTGINNEEVQKTWIRVFDEQLGSLPIKQIILTHFHPDHIGCAAFLRDKYGVEIGLSEVEWTLANNLFNCADKDYKENVRVHYQSAGVPDDLLDYLLKSRCGYRKLVKSLPDSSIALYDDDVLPCSIENWRIVSTPGHSPGHNCFYNEEQNIMLTGDHVLPNITPNISILPFFRNTNPLKNYISSLKRLQKSECEQYFPAHGLPQANLQVRLGQLLKHHEKILEKIKNGYEKPLTVFESLPLIFERELSDSQMHFALGEALAHLEYLVSTGDFYKQGDSVVRFTKR